MSVLKQYNAAAGIWQTVGGMGLPQTPVSFSAHKNGVDQNYGTTTWAYVKLAFSTKHWDNNSCFDTTTSMFTPQVAGKYMVTANATFKNAGSGIHCELMIYKNGVLHKDTVIFCALANGWPAPNLATIVDMNGTADYLEVFVRCNQASININGAAEYTFFQACLIPDSYDSTKQIVDLTNATSDYLLCVGETAKIRYANATSVPLHIKTEEGLYEVDVCGDQSVTLGTLSSVLLSPNNAIVTAGVIDEVQIYNIVSSTGTNSTAPSGSGNGTTNTAFQLAYGILVSGSYRLSTFTKSKVVKADYFRKDTATEFIQFKSVMNWNDTITIWSSLGTITFPFAQSGTIIIKRIA